ncbi:MAG: acyl-CoA synthetase [Actinomycetes bacterium]
MEFNFADMFEANVDGVGERTALVFEDTRLTFAELEDRVNRLAHHFQAAGIAVGDHVGIYAYNGVEWVESMAALYKIRAVPVNINYRYVESELRYLFDNADLRAVVLQREFAPRVAGIIGELPLLTHIVVSEDGSGAPLDGLTGRPGVTVVDYDEAKASQSPARDFAPRSADDIHMIYTGGTTGMPKGVMWRQEDIFYTLCGGIDAYTNEKVQRPEELSEKARAAAGPTIFFPIAPLMHGAGQVSTIRGLIHGDTTVLVRKFDAHEAWRLCDRERVNVLGITGDAMARPLADALEELFDDLDLSSLFSIGSSAAIFSQSIKDQLMARLPNVLIVDSVGATETGMNGIKIAQPGEAPKGGPATVAPSRDSIVIDEDFRQVEPGSEVVGRIARTGNIPLGYYKDPERTAQVFPTIDGVRYSVPGDFAKVEADGNITLLGRGSIVINTGGEKVYPEEVEGALKGHPEVFDVLVVGVPDERWGEAVAAVVQPREGTTPTLESLATHCREHVAGYKVPKRLYLVDQIVRAPSGKPDYPWAKEYARAAAAAQAEG